MHRSLLLLAFALTSLTAFAAFESDGYSWEVNSTGLKFSQAEKECTSQGLRLASYDLLKQLRSSSEFIRGLQNANIYQYGILWSDRGGKPQAVNVNLSNGSQFDVPTAAGYPLPFVCVESVIQANVGVPNQWIAGDYGSTTGAARQSWTETCQEWRSFLGGLLGARYQDLECGAADCRPYGGQYICGSNATLRISYNQKKVVTPKTELSIAPSQSHPVSAYRQAYLEWRDVCWNWMRNQKYQLGYRFLAASCDIPVSIAPTGMLRFSSQSPVTYQTN